MAKELVTAETNLNGKKTRKTPVPAGYGRIVSGALNLSLEERVELRNELSRSIDNEIKEMEQRFNAAKLIVAPK